MEVSRRLLNDLIWTSKKDDRIYTLSSKEAKKIVEDLMRLEDLED